MGVLFSDPKDKEAYYRDQAQKARRQSRQAAMAGNRAEADRLRSISHEAQLAADSQRELIEEAGR